MTGLLHELILPCVYAFFGSLGFSFVFNLHGKNILYYKYAYCYLRIQL